MKNLLILFFSLLLYEIKAQEKLLTSDSTGKIYVLFVRDDSIAVAYQGRQTAFTTDGLFARNFSAFDLKLTGFLKFSGLKENLSDFTKSDVVVKEEDPIIDGISVDSRTTNIYKNLSLSGGKFIAESESYKKITNSVPIISGMSGYDFAPIIAQQGEKPWEFKNWVQDFVSIPGKKSVWKDENKIYFLKPPNYETNTSYNLMDFDIRFPEFSLPTKKIVVIQPTPSREKGVNNYLKKGVSFSKYAPEGKDYKFVGDDWLYELGCPKAYVSTQSQMDAWCINVDADALLLNFINKVYSPNKNAGYVLLNWEAVGVRWNVEKWKIVRCLEYWATHEHKAKLALWGVHPLYISKPIFQSWGFDYSTLLNFQGSIDELRLKYLQYVSTENDYSKQIDVIQIGGYQNQPSEDGVIHHYLTELLLNKKYYPDKPAIATIWHDVELIDNFELGYVNVNYSGGTYQKSIKPKITPSQAYNWGVWATAVGDGLDCWNEPYPWTEEKEYYGYYAYQNGKELPVKFGENASIYAAQPLKVIDWIMSGVWAISQNKEIIEATGEWKWKELPSASYHKKEVLIAYKLNQEQTSALVLAYDNFGKIDSETTHHLNIHGKDYSVKTYGRFTSVIKLNL